ncbi:MAG: sulfotransferase [Deltaproteobacteria bacterium]|nr:sulfotransferase [Deltaproteobacteria bacterium]
MYSFMRPGKVLFVKTLKNCVRILALRQIFPEAKILFLYRDPRAILKSWWQAKGYHHLTSGYHRHPYYAKQSDGKFYWQPPPLEGEDLAGYSYDEIVARADAATEGPWWNTYESFLPSGFAAQGRFGISSGQFGTASW